MGNYLHANGSAPKMSEDKKLLLSLLRKRVTINKLIEMLNDFRCAP